MMVISIVFSLSLSLSLFMLLGLKWLAIIKKTLIILFISIKHFLTKTEKKKFKLKKKIQIYK
jgi:hypothetical protein